MDRPDRATLLAFFGAMVVGGVNFVAVRFSNRELEPLYGAGVRFGLAALLLLGWMRLRRHPVPRGRVLAATVAYGILAFTITYALAYWGLQRLDAGVGAVVFGATPLLTILLAAVHGLERMTGRRVVGSLLALAGILVLADPFAADRLPVLPLLALLAASLGAAESTVILKLVPPEHPVSTNAVAMTIGATLLLGLSLVAGEAWVVPSAVSTWVAVGYLIALGSIGLFGMILFTLRRWTASAAAYITAAFPVVAMIAGAVIADEAITGRGVVGGLLVIGAVYVGALRRSGV